MPSPTYIPPMRFEGVPEEGPATTGYGTSDSAWAGSDISMLLHTL